MRQLTLLIIGLFCIGYTQASDDFKFRLSPNPATSTVYVTPDNFSGEIKIEIFSVIGNKLSEHITWSVNGEEISVNIAHIPDGIYLVRVSSGEHTSVKRLKIQHG